MQVNINIAALGGYYLINQHTLAWFIQCAVKPRPSGRGYTAGFPPDQVFAVVQCIGG